MSDTQQAPVTPPLLNVAIGFLAILLVILLSALVYRFAYPKVLTERSDANTLLISEIIQIQVLNGVGTSGLASRFTERLRQSGFDVIETGNFETFDVQNTYIIDRSGNLENARRVARALGVSEQNILREVAEGYYLDATVVIGADYDALTLN